MTRSLGKILRVSFLGIALFGSCVAAADSEDIFYLQELPKGRSVTLPNPATTYAPLTSRINLGSTDLPQSLKLSAVATRGGEAPSFRVAIFDQQSERVQYIKVDGKNPVLYMFKSLAVIQIVPKPKSAVVAQAAYLKIESNRPLSIAH